MKRISLLLNNDIPTSCVYGSGGGDAVIVCSSYHDESYYSSRLVLVWRMDGVGRV